MVDQHHRMSNQSKSPETAVLALPEMIFCRKSTEPQTGQRDCQLYSGQPPDLRDLRTNSFADFVLKLAREPHAGQTWEHMSYLCLKPH